MTATTPTPITASVRRRVDGLDWGGAQRLRGRGESRDRAVLLAPVANRGSELLRGNRAGRDLPRREMTSRFPTHERL